ncbi:MAG: GAF domain-containing sensor histidine kinase [Ketobacteraceae bacterium]|nr:GAF domain-containing sensor histidine kinase [Ketobacteraceae bacterium]
MTAAELPDNESSRLQALLDYQILDTEPETAYDDLTLIASQICGTPISLVSLIDKDRQWFKSRVGLDASETPRDLAFCAHAILQKDVFLVEDTHQDSRFATNPLVTGSPHIRFYAGAPLITKEGYGLGTLCVIDREPRKLTDNQLKALKALAHQVVSQLELRLHTLRLERMKKLRDRLLAMVSHDLRSAFSINIGFAQALRTRLSRLSEDDIVSSLISIEDSSRKAHEQLEAMLEWSRRQLGERQFTLETINVREICQDILEQMKESASQKNIQLKLQCPDAIAIRANKILFRSAVQNLVSNAIKFSHRDTSVDITVSNDGTHTTIAVSDKGIGMDRKVTDRLFDENERITTPGTQGETGTGLGSVLVKDFVDSVQGELTVTSAPDRGTTISFTVPHNELFPGA